MTRIAHRLGAPVARRPASGFDGWGGTVTSLVSAWLRRWHTRRSLAKLDMHLLRDIGMAPETRAAEVAKPFWRA